MENFARVAFFPRCWKQLLIAAALAFFVSGCSDSEDRGAIQEGYSPCVNDKISAENLAGTGQLQVTSMDQVAAKRTSPTSCEYSYKISIRNIGSANATNVKAAVSSAPAATDVLKGEVLVGNIASGATVTSMDMVILRAQRNVKFNLSELIWNITSDTVRQLDPVKPAEVVVLPLADLGLPDGDGTVTVSGAVTDVLLKDGTLRFSTPGDTGAQQTASFTVTSGGVTETLSLPIVSERPIMPLVYVEPSESGSSSGTPPSLSITGLGPSNSFVGNPVTFKLEGIPSQDLADDSDGLISGTSNVEVSLKNYWAFNAADNSFTISGEKLQQLMAALPTGALRMSLNFVSKNGDFAVNYDLLAAGKGASIAGKIITPQGNPVTGLAGKKILLRGFNQHMRQVATVDAGGNFSFIDIIPDTYQLTLNDLVNPNVVSASTAIYQDTTTANVSLIYSPGEASLSGGT